MPSCTGSSDPSSHMQNRCKQDREWKCTARQSGGQGNWGRVVKEMKVRARFHYAECNLPRRESRGYPVYFTQSEFLSWLCCLAWQTFGSSSNGTDTLQWSQVQWSPGKQRKMCWAQTQRWSQPSEHVSIGYQKKNFSAASRCSTECGQSVFCAHCCFVWLFISHMLFLSFLCHKWSHIKHYCFYSIVCLYQQQYDCRVRVASGEQEKQWVANDMLSVGEN